MKKLIFALILLAMMPVGRTMGCTSALVSAQRGNDGRWLLWKHRDSGFADNYVRNFAPTDSTMGYVALFNAADTAALEAWIGYNEAGFAVMNTASYNLTAPARNWQDREGLLMTEALRSCRSVGDFYRLLTDSCRQPRGVEANFGVFDAEGNGAYFEVDDRKVVVYDMDSVAGLLTRTNYSLSGCDENRLGVSRHCSEQHLLDSVMATQRPWAPAGKLAAEDFIETLSRSFYLPSEGIDLLDGTAKRRRDTGDVISRRSSSASVVVEGPRPGQSPSEGMTMWVAIGFPALSEVRAARIDSVSPDLLPTAPGCHSPLCDRVNRWRSAAFLPATAPAGSSKSGNQSSSKSAKGNQSSSKSAGKPRYDFNLPYLREQIPLRRAASLPNYRRR